MHGAHNVREHLWALRRKVTQPSNNTAGNNLPDVIEQKETGN